MTDHAVIGKFIGFWSTEKALYNWIAAKWKPRGDVTLQLGPKGFFTAIFFCLEDKYRILVEGTYFFNSAGLYLRDWAPRFNPDMEDLTWALVWIRLYSLPNEYWDEDILRNIGNGLGEYIKAAEETKMRRYTSYAHICVFMRLDKALPESVSLSHRDYEWIQPLDYEHVPFRCRKCHAIGHLFRDCPLNVKATAPVPTDSLTHDGFTKAPTRKRAHKKPSTGKKPQQNNTSDPAVRNSFGILAQSTEEQNTSSIHNFDLPSSSTQPPPSAPSSESPPTKDTPGNPRESKEKQVEKDNEM